MAIGGVRRLSKELVGNPSFRSHLPAKGLQSYLRFEGGMTEVGARRVQSDLRFGGMTGALQLDIQIPA